jgi:hypothetical protein
MTDRAKRHQEFDVTELVPEFNPLPSIPNSKSRFSDENALFVRFLDEDGKSILPEPKTTEE